MSLETLGHRSSRLTQEVVFLQLPLGSAREVKERAEQGLGQL